MSTLDASDLDQHMGVPMEPGELKEPVALNDIRRWVQAMHYPNPLHYDERWAAESRFGSIVAPQSLTVATDTSHGCSPAQVGKIPNSHLIFGRATGDGFGGRARLSFGSDTPAGDTGALPTRFYAWASLIQDGRVVATDYAPDTGWFAPSPNARP